MTTTTHSPKIDPGRALAAAVCGAEVYEMALAAAPAAAAIHDQLKAFVDGPHGQAIAAYWQAWQNVECSSDWMTDASMEMLHDVDQILYAIAGLVGMLNPSYTEGGLNPSEFEKAQEVVDRLRVPI